MPLENDRLVRAWEVAADEWARRHALHGDTDPEHPDLLWWAQMMADAREELRAHFEFAGWARGWLTRRWLGRMNQLTELW